MSAPVSAPAAPTSPDLRAPVAASAAGRPGPPLLLPRDGAFWRRYALAWAPMLTAYFGFILATNGVGRPLSALVLALENVLPAALAGVLPVAAARRWPLGDEAGGAARARAALRHLGAAALYSVLWYAGLRAVISVEWSVVRGAPTLAVFSGRETRWQLGSGLLVYAAVAALAMVADAGARLRAARRRAEEAEALRQRAELAALRAQLNPHFLFNTLHALLELVRSGDPEAEDAIERFAALSRYALDPRADAAAEVPLARELRAVRDYVAIERLRLGDRLCVTFEVDAEAPRCAVPVLTLQPLVENAVRHAAAPRVAATRVTVWARVEAGALRLGVRDDGPGADPAAVLAAPGVGLRAVTRRVALRYGAAGGVDVKTRPGEGFAVAVRLPARAGRATPEPPADRA